MAFFFTKGCLDQCRHNLNKLVNLYLLSGIMKAYNSSCYSRAHRVNIHVTASFTFYTGVINIFENYIINVCLHWNFYLSVILN